ncbi:hypothetical protein WCD74_07690 [Actinomycetospora sp. OC33-EN08]|uniref:Uncharacterized protein n=1 Tax=Actinomycetospora aurantiaca TaxID=3129233 RepID=A0ABU8MK85_9PSEU
MSETGRTPRVELLGRLLRSAVVAPRGRFRATADYVTSQGPPSSAVPRRFSPFRDDGPPRGGQNHDECEIVLHDCDHWHVTTSRGGDYRRTGDDVVVGYPGHAPLEMDVENLRAPNADWPYYAGHWAEELVLPHRLLGLLDDLLLDEDDEARPRLRGTVSLRQPEAYQGMAGHEVLEVEFTVDLQLAVIVDVTARTWDHRVDRYTLEVLELNGA